MKVVIAGSRNCYSIPDVQEAIERSGFDITEIVSGGCSGVDSIAEEYATIYGIPFKLFKADWETHGKSAGPIRNLEMAKYAEALIAVWDGHSRGTMNMIKNAETLGLKVFIHRIKSV